MTGRPQTLLPANDHLPRGANSTARLSLFFRPVDGKKNSAELVDLVCVCVCNIVTQ